MSKEIENRVKKIPEGEWWTIEGEEGFCRLAEELCSKGFSLDEAIEFLKSAYAYVSAEFGS